jgi:hypothetical protein
MPMLVSCFEILHQRIKVGAADLADRHDELCCIRSVARTLPNHRADIAVAGSGSAWAAAVQQLAEIEVVRYGPMRAVKAVGIRVSH